MKKIYEWSQNHIELNLSFTFKVHSDFEIVKYWFTNLLEYFWTLG